MNNNDINSAWAAVVPILRKLDFYDKGSLNQAALVMQLLRSRMSDAHGTKPVIKPLVFDSIKWSQIIVRLLSEKYDA